MDSVEVRWCDVGDYPDKLEKEEEDERGKACLPCHVTITFTTSYPRKFTPYGLVRRCFLSFPWL
jgi:hypothetical protein